MDPYWSAIVHWRTRCTRDTQTWIITSHYPYQLQSIWLLSMQHADFYCGPYSYNGEQRLRSLCIGFLPHAWPGFYSLRDCLECCIDRHIRYASLLLSGLLATFSPATSSLSVWLNERYRTIWKHKRRHDNLYRQKTALSRTVKQRFWGTTCIQTCRVS
jgi:hypothetical protein